MSKPDFEDPQGGGTANGSNTYMLVVAASDGAEAEAEAQTGYKKVEVEVTNVDEDATISIELSSLQPQISTAITVDYVDGVGNPLVNASGVKNIAIMDPDRDKGAPDKHDHSHSGREVAVVQVVQQDWDVRGHHRGRRR